MKSSSNFPIPKSLQQSFHQNTLKSIEKNILYTLPLTFGFILKANADEKKQFEYMPALEGLDYGKPRTIYPDYIRKPSGLQYKLVKEGTGDVANVGDRVTVDWEGYTIGYYGRPFQTRNKVKGGAFDSSETDYYRWVVGSGTTIAAIDEVVKYLKEGSIAQVIIPPELGYPIGDSDHTIVGPR